MRGVRVFSMFLGNCLVPAGLTTPDGGACREFYTDHVGWLNEEWVSADYSDCFMKTVS
jgi:hypothetical protein